MFLQIPQQSPPSKLQGALFVSSLQYPLLNNGLGVDSVSRHVHMEQYFVMTHDPQQSPPSKLQSALLVSSLQKPSPICDPSSVQSIF